MVLTTRTKESIKTALAMTIAYGIALSMDWDRPYWAGFAVAFISLSTVGQSLNKGALRMLGTLLAFVVSLTIIALFAQERWWFMVALSAWVGFCTYRMGVSRRWYFWFLAGFASVVISFDGGTNPVNAFETAVLRAEETALGILVYSLISVLLWPTGTRAELDSATRALSAAQRKLYSNYLRAMTGQGEADDAHAVRMQEVQARNRFNQALAGARTDSYEVWELRRQWQRFQDQSIDLMETLERWHESLKEVEGLDLNRLLPNLDALTGDLDARFARIERMLAGDAPEGTPRAIDLPFDKDAVRALSPFHKAAFVVTRTRLQHIEALTRGLFDTVRDLKGFGGASAPEPVKAHLPGSKLLPDPDHLAAAVRAMAGLWLAYLLWIYITVPGGSGLVTAMGPFGMMLASHPQMRVSMLIRPVFVGIAFAGTLYIFIMPQLSSFAGLGPMIFAATFAICYLFAAPRQGVSRSIGLAMFVILIGVSNQQSYDFLSIADTALMFVLIFALLMLAAYIPVSNQPESVFLRLLGRFFRSGEYLMSTMRWDPTRKLTRLERWKKVFHAQEVATLPRKLFAWAPHIDIEVLPDTSTQQVQALVINLQALAFRMQELLEARGNPQAEFLMRELLVDVRAWRIKVQQTFKGLSENPVAREQKALRSRLDETIGHLETRTEETLDRAAEGQISDQDSENFYRLLGAFRGVSEALVDYAGSAGAIDWARWRENRF